MAIVHELCRTRGSMLVKSLRELTLFTSLLEQFGIELSIDVVLMSWIAIGLKSGN